MMALPLLTLSLIDCWLFNVQWQLIHALSRQEQINRQQVGPVIGLDEEEIWTITMITGW